MVRVITNRRRRDNPLDQRQPARNPARIVATRQRCEASNGHPERSPCGTLNLSLTSDNGLSRMEFVELETIALPTPTPGVEHSGTAVLHRYFDHAGR